MKKAIHAVLLGVVLGLASLVPDATAQAAASADVHPSDRTGEKNISQRPVTVYRLEFTLSEIDAGKKINARSYSMLAEDDAKVSKLRVGTKVRVPEFNQFQDIGVSIDCWLQQQESALLMDAVIDASNISQSTAPSDSTHVPPAVHQLRAEIRSVVTPGKPTVLTSMDDPTSKVAFEIELTATKLK
jgi:hypothetical protein